MNETNYRNDGNYRRQDDYRNEGSYQRQDRYRTMAIPVAQEPADIRAEFIRKTYMHVALAVLGFVMVEALVLKIPFIQKMALSMTQGMTWLLVLGLFMFGTTALERWALQSEDRNQQYLALIGYVILEALIFVPILYKLTAFAGADGMQLISQAALLTLFLFTGLTAVVFTTKKDFSFLRSALTVGGFLAMGLIVVSMIFGFHLGVIFSFAMVALAAGSILYQTSRILHDHHKEQYVGASLGLFASLMLLFWYILQILMSFMGD